MHTAADIRLFEDGEIMSLWAQGVVADKELQQECDTIKAEERDFPQRYCTKF